MKIRIKTAASFLIFFTGLVNACAAETVLNIPKNEAYMRLLNGDTAFIFEAEPAQAVEISKIDAALPFYAALLIEEHDDERARILLDEALKSPVVRDAAMKKLAPPEESAVGFESGIAGNIAAGRTAIAKRDYNEALRKFRAALDEEGPEAFITDTDALGDLGKAFQFASGGAVIGAELFMDWEKVLRNGGLLQDLSVADREARRYLLLYYAGRMRRQRAAALVRHSSRQREEYDEAKTLFTSALYIAPDKTQSDACIWYILDTEMAKNDKKTAETTGLLKKYAPLWHDPSYFSDFLEKFTHILCLNQRWDEIAELFPYIRGYGSPEITAQYAFILANAVELNFLTRDTAAAALEPLLQASSGSKTAYQTASESPHPNDFYQIVYDSDVIAGGDVSSFYYIDAAAKKLGKTPRLNIPDDPGGESAGEAGDPLVKKFLSGFFTFGAARFAYPYIMENSGALSIPEFRSLAKSLAEAGRWGESIRAARTYMQRPDYKPALSDIKLCYPFAYKDLVNEFSRKTGMDENLLQGLIRTESLFIPDIVSRAGAAGLTQLMPETASEMARQLARNGGPDYIGDGSLDLGNPALNIHLGTLYFQQLKNRMNSTLLALLSYNGGVNRITRWRRSRPQLNDALFLESVEYEETRNYGRQVLAAAAIYRCLRSGRHAPTIGFKGAPAA